MSCKPLELPHVPGKLINVNGAETLALIQCHRCNNHFAAAVRPLVEEEGGQLTCPLCNAVMLVDVIPDSDPLPPEDMEYSLRVAISITSRLPATMIEQLIDFLDLADRPFESLIMAYRQTHPVDIQSYIERGFVQMLQAVIVARESNNE